jgi:hypothetical protein
MRIVTSGSFQVPHLEDNKLAGDRVYENVIFVGCQALRGDEIAAALTAKIKLAADKIFIFVLPPAVFPKHEVTFRGMLLASMQHYRARVDVVYCQVGQSGFPDPLLPPTAEVMGSLLPSPFADCGGLLYLSHCDLGSAEVLNFISEYFRRLSEKFPRGKINCKLLGTAKLHESLSVLLEKFSNIVLSVEERVSEENFQALMRAIAKNSGIVGMTGGTTFIQAVLLGCEVRFLAVHEANHPFLQHLLQEFSGDPLQEVASRILGLIHKTEQGLPDNAVRQVHQKLKSLFAASIVTFSNKLTGIVASETQSPAPKYSKLARKMGMWGNPLARDLSGAALLGASAQTGSALEVNYSPNVKV